MSDDFISTKGKVVGLKLDVRKEKKDGGTWKAHVFLLETEDGEQEKFIVNAKSKAGPFVEKLKKGQEVTVKQKDDKFKNVIAVFSNEFTKRGQAKASSFVDTRDPTGPIQGNILTNAVTLSALKGLNSADDIIASAKEILKAKEVIDSLVVQSLKSKEESKNANNERSRVESNEDLEDDQEMDEDFEETKSRKNQSPY